MLEETPYLEFGDNEDNNRKNNKPYHKGGQAIGKDAKMNLSFGNRTKLKYFAFEKEALQQRYPHVVTRPFVCRLRMVIVDKFENIKDFW